MEIPFFDLEVLKKFEKEFPHRIWKNKEYDGIYI
jgi:hypothetical protein